MSHLLASPPITVTCNLALIGADWPGGTYVLRIALAKAQTIVFGRFDGGRAIRCEPGEYAYVGSALALKGATCLPRRLVRHATRCGRRAPHAIRAQMLDVFPVLFPGHGDLRLANGKNPLWNVDHLLDLPAAELTGVVAIRSPIRLEATVGRLLMDDPASIIFEAGLGANDIPGNTHLLRVEAGDEWWDGLPNRLAGLLRDAQERQ